MKINYHPKLKELARKLRNNGTKSEIKLWQYLKGKKMMGYDFHRQKPIDSFIVDFFCNKLKLAVELDGYTHTFEETAKKDTLKQERLNALGITVLRFCDEDVMKNIEGVLVSYKKYFYTFSKNNLLNLNSKLRDDNEFFKF
ncbi:MAG: endonuclease domain-containing protein, partial [Candidatus Brocadia sp.]|nr:endonuclease domain-containing protein [Candidatus Brocadia sp.]